VDGTILIVTEDEALLDDLLRLCAAAHARVEVAHSPPGGADGTTGPWWTGISPARRRSAT